MSAKDETGDLLTPYTHQQPSSHSSLGECVLLDSKQVEMLDLRKLSGMYHGLSYRALSFVELQSTTRDSLLLRFVAYEVTIIGERLTEVYERLLEHRVVRLTEIDPITASQDAEQPLVLEIEVLRKE